MVFSEEVGSRAGIRTAEIDFFDDFYGALLGGGASAVSSAAGRP
jgi:hypothetical protein